MKCPECGATDNIKWLLRAQHEDKEITTANVITVLCTGCGKNESIFINDYLTDLFPSWNEIQEADIARMLAQATEGESILELPVEGEEISPPMEGLIEEVEDNPIEEEEIDNPIEEDKVDE